METWTKFTHYHWKKGDPELSWLVHLKNQLINQNVKIYVQNVKDDHVKWSVWLFYKKVYFYTNFM